MLIFNLQRLLPPGVYASLLINGVNKSFCTRQKLSAVFSHGLCPQDASITVPSWGKLFGRAEVTAPCSDTRLFTPRHRGTQPKAALLGRRPLCLQRVSRLRSMCCLSLCFLGAPNTNSFRQSQFRFPFFLRNPCKKVWIPERHLDKQVSLEHLFLRRDESQITACSQKLLLTQGAHPVSEGNDK